MQPTSRSNKFQSRSIEELVIFGAYQFYNLFIPEINISPSTHTFGFDRSSDVPKRSGASNHPFVSRFAVNAEIMNKQSNDMTWFCLHYLFFNRNEHCARVRYVKSVLLVASFADTTCNV